MPSSLSPSSRLRACPERAGSNEEDYCHRGHAAHARQYVCRNCGSQLGQRVRAEWDRVHPADTYPRPNAPAYSNYGGFSLVWTESVVQPHCRVSAKSGPTVI
jgi:hypothetical protein